MCIDTFREGRYRQPSYQRESIVGAFTRMSAVNLFTGFLDTAHRMPEKVAVQFEGQSLTFRALRQAALSVARYLGDRRGQHVGLLAGNTPAFISGYFGILGAGGVGVPFNAMLKPAELLPLLQHAQVQLLLVAKPLAALGNALCAAGASCQILVIDDLPEAGDTDEPAFYGTSLIESDLAMILYTSGTTGDPKGVMLTHGNFLANFHSFNAAFGGFRVEDAIICVLPLFHSFAFTAELLPCVLVGSKLVLCPSFKPKQVFQLWSTESSVVFIAVPPMYGMLAATAPVGGRPQANVRIAISGGGPMPSEVQQRFENTFGFDIYEGYGLTEAAPVLTSNFPTYKENRKGTVGLALPGVELQVWDDEGKTLPRGAEGELVARGPNIMRGYFNNPSATAAALTAEGWLRTGDMAVIDNDGYVRIVGRKKELIVSAGENIHPREVEEVLVQHPAVYEAAVIGIPDKIKTEVPKAFLCPEPGAPLETVDIASVRTFCRERLAPHKVPVAWQVLEALPRTSTGKINKKVLS